MQVLGVVPARSGSKGIPRKNLKELDGKPLLAHQVENSVAADTIDQTIISTDSEEFASIARKYGAEVPFLRPAELADDDVSVIATYKHAAEYYQKHQQPPDYIVGLQPTCPFTEPAGIDTAVDKIRRTDADSVVSVTETDPEHHPYRSYRVEGDRLRSFGDVTVDNPTQRQGLPPVYGLTGGIFVRTCAVLNDWDNDSFGLGEESRVVEQSGESTIDIDTPYELRLARAVVEYQTEADDRPQ